MNEIQDGFVSRWLAARLGITDQAPTPTLAPEIMPVMIAVPDSIENELQRGTWLCGAAGTAPAFAGVMAAFEIHNPLTSGVVMMIDNLRLGSVTINQTIEYGWYPADAPTPTLLTIFSAVRDTRVPYVLPPVGNNTAARVGIVTAASGAYQVPRLGRIYGPVREWLEPNIVLAPGSTFRCNNTTANISFEFTCHWRERKVQPAEVSR
jgi:hypothetical protein